LPRLNNAYLAKAAAASGSGTGTINYGDFGTHIGKHHARTRPWTDPCYFYDFDSVKCACCHGTTPHFEGTDARTKREAMQSTNALGTLYPHPRLSRTCALDLHTGRTLRLTLQFGLLARATTHVILFRRRYAKTFWGRRQARPTYNNKGSRYELFRHTQ
jgi:hypothetical protein